MIDYTLFVGDAIADTGSTDNVTSALEFCRAWCAAERIEAYRVELQFQCGRARVYLFE